MLRPQIRRFGTGNGCRHGIDQVERHNTSRSDDEQLSQQRRLRARNRSNQ
jgi:hypothetical protein